ncbi:MAG: hypothetical protein IKN78_03800 [Bacteroidales bacterium]|nr:hypothetical protein [Bacteroidales bacterium]
MGRKLIPALTACLLLGFQTVIAQNNEAVTEKVTAKDSTKSLGTLTIGGYGEAVYKYNFFSDNVFRYSRAANYADSRGHGRIDLPHAVIMLGYDFGHGWSFNTEIEFEHGGTESAVEIEAEEAGEFEKEIERGGEVALEQFWLQKAFWGGKMNIRAGHIVVPVGGTNNAHLPNQFFGVYRPEGENTIIPCTWHETGIELWGRIKDWRYDVMLIPSLNSSMFNVSGWVHNGSASPYEFRVANKLGVAFRLDNYSVKGLHIGVSGFVGNTFRNDIVTDEHSARYADVRGTLAIGGLDFSYQCHGFVLRGSGLYGYLSDAAMISVYNSTLSNSSQSPYPHTLVGQSAWSAGGELGYDLFHTLKNPKMDRHKLYLFARYEYYDSYLPAHTLTDYEWTDRHCVSAGLNYSPIKEIIIKAEGGVRLLKAQYNDEPWCAIGITWAGMFSREFRKRT